MVKKFVDISFKTYYNIFVKEFLEGINMTTCKLIAFILICQLMMLMIVGCGKKNNGTTDDGNSPDVGGELAYTSNGDGTCYVSGIGNSRDLEINIPEKSPAGDTVVGIGEKAFAGCGKITSVTVPNGVTYVGDNAFEYCVSLGVVNLPDSVASIGCNAFMNCIELHDVHIPEGVSEIKAGTFSDCYDLTKITIPAGVTSIDPAAFFSCTSLVEMCNKSSLIITADGNDTYLFNNHLINVISDESESCIKKIGEFVFYDDGGVPLFVRYIGDNMEISLPTYGEGYNIHDFAFYMKDIVSLVIPEGVSEIGRFAIEANVMLARLVLPSTLKAIDESNLTISFSLIEIVDKSGIVVDDDQNPPYDEFKTNIKTVGDYIFYDDGEIIYLLKYLGDEKDVTLPVYDGGKKYEVYGFSFVTNKTSTLDNGGYEGTIRSVVIPDYVTSISDAFYGCKNLQSVVIGDGVEAMGGFGMCPAIKSIVIGKNVSDVGYKGFSVKSAALESIVVDPENPYFKSVDNVLYSKDGKTLVKYAPGKSDTSFVVPDGVTTIDYYAISGCQNLTSITLPESVTNLQSHAMAECTALTRLVIPKSVMTVGDTVVGSTVGTSSTYLANLTVYYTGTERQWKSLLDNNENVRRPNNLPETAIYNYVPEN